MKYRHVLLLAAVLGGCSSAPTRPTDLHRGDEQALQHYITELVAHEMRKTATPGMSIALVDDQRVVWAQGFGQADLERNIPASAQTIYRVGSISKLFTDTATMQLAEQGKIDIDRPLQDALPGFTIRQRGGPGASITPRLLMTHHAGLPRDRLKGFMTPRPEPFVQLVDTLRDSYTVNAPGEIFSYSNLGISLLGAAVQNVSGVEFAQQLRQSLLLPLRMSNASFETGPASSALMAQAYRGHEVQIEPRLRDVPAGGLNASVEDLSHFMSMVFAGGTYEGQRILKPESIAEMLRPQNEQVALDLNFQVGIGWMLSTLGRSTLQGGGVVAHHAGATAYYRSQLYILPEHKLGVVVLANSSTATQAVDHVATETLALALEAKTGIKQPAFVPVPPAGTEVPEATIAAAVGDYTTLAGPARLFATGRSLHAEIGGRTVDLLLRADGLLALDYTLLGLIHVNLGPLSDAGLSVRHVAGHDVLVARIGTQEMLVGDKLAPPRPLGEWQQRLGRYEFTNLGDDHPAIERFRLTEERGFLLAEVTTVEAPNSALRIVLMPVSNTEALALGVLADGGETISVRVVDGEQRLEISGYEARRVGP